MTFDDTLTDPEFAEAMRGAHDECFGAPGAREADLAVDGLHPSVFSKILSSLLPKG